MLPFLKWAGGKRWLVNRHREWFDVGSGRLVEPFVGSGAVFFKLEPKSAVLSDLNAELIATYKGVRDNPDAVLRHLRMHHRRHSKEYYYQIRASRPRSASSVAARLIYLNRTCFNGLYRVNQQGAFNVPVGSKSSVLLGTDDFQSAAACLHNAKLQACDFEVTVKRARRNDLLYLDPPYTVKHNNNNFAKYNERMFSWEDQERLASALEAAAGRGARVLLSNADHPSVHNLYSNSIWEHLIVPRFSGIGSSADYRRRTTETVISNYLTSTGAVVEPRR